MEALYHPYLRMCTYIMSWIYGLSEKVVRKSCTGQAYMVRKNG